MRASTAAFVFAIVASTSVEAHITLWSKALFGFNYNLQSTNDPSMKQNYNTNAMVTPLRGMDNLTEAEWFAHGAKGYPPADGDFLILESGSTMTFELACNRQLTTFGDPAVTKQKGGLPEYACGDDKGPLHNANEFGKPLNRSLFGGTALAIAYTTDYNSLKPSNMTVISVNATSPWTREVQYRIPAGLPPGEALVTWNWIHLKMHKEGYGSEFYNTLYRAKVVGKTDSKNMVGQGTVPVKCEGQPGNCVVGPKQPMYLWQKDGNNMEPPQNEENPSYNERYGYNDGAQDDAIMIRTGSAARRTTPGGLGAAIVLVAGSVLAAVA